MPTNWNNVEQVKVSERTPFPSWVKNSSKPNYYPEHSVIFNKFKLIVFEYTNNLFKYYIDCFIKKEKPLREYPFQYKNHLFKLHEIFKANLKPEGKKVDKKVVIDYINQLHPAQLMFVINYQHNPDNLDNQENLDNPQDMSI